MARLLSLSVFSMLVTVPGETPSAEANCPVAAGPGTACRADLIDRFDVVFDRQARQAKVPCC